MAGGVCIYDGILVLIASVFKPALDNFHAAFRDHPPDFRDLVRLEAAIEGQRQVVQPDFTFVAGLENMNVHPLNQVVAVKADPVAVLNENRGHDAVEIVVPSGANQTKTSTPFSLQATAGMLAVITAQLISLAASLRHH